MIFHGQIFGKYGAQIRRWQTIGEGTKKSGLCRMLVPIETIAGGKYIVIELHHGQHRSVQQVDILLGGTRRGLKDSVRARKRRTRDG